MKRVMILVALLIGFLAGLSMQTIAQGSSPGNCKSECATCASTCEATLNYCLKKPGKHIDETHIKALQDCISTCKQSADFMARGSKLQNSACNLCEKACLKCAELCETFTGDKKMKACAEECRKCADACHSMAS